MFPVLLFMLSLSSLAPSQLVQMFKPFSVQRCKQEKLQKKEKEKQTISKFIKSRKWCLIEKFAKFIQRCGATESCYNFIVLNYAISYSIVKCFLGSH